uniref:DJ-1/PfpI domain-containing protein n=1 Tax=Aegilops tauschii TaxID=37682 RepID=R7W7Y9_AEGTA
MATSPSPKKVLLPIVAGTEPIEASIPIDILRRAGANVTVASAGDALLVEIMYGVKILADELLVDCAAASYDLIVLPRKTWKNSESINSNGITEYKTTT